MNGKRYYITTITAWQRHTPRCSETHFIALDSDPAPTPSLKDSVAQARLRSQASASADSAASSLDHPAASFQDAGALLAAPVARPGVASTVGEGHLGSPSAEASRLRHETLSSVAGGANQGNLIENCGCEVAHDTPILALVTADEAAHIALENDPEVEPLPHPLARTPISGRAAAALAPFGIVVGDDTFVMAEKLARIHPLLKHRVF